jgi:hypothetical protein
MVFFRIQANDLEGLGAIRPFVEQELGADCMTAID